MAGEFSIASFNLHNFNFDVRGGGSGVDPKFKEKKAKADRICEIIRTGAYDIIALQEVQTPETVASLIGLLNDGNLNGRYAFVHCHDFYETISNGRFKSPSTQKQGELAFIYDSESVALFEDYAVYQRLYDRLWLALDYCVSGVSAVAATWLGVGSLVPDDDEDDEQRRRKRKSGNGRLAKGAVAFGIAGGGYAAHKYIEAQLRRMRPPFVALFHKKMFSGIDESRQLRLINVHSQFSRSHNEFFDKFSTAAQIRTKEAEYILGAAFQIVKSERARDASLALTMALGDFNRSGLQLQEIAGRENVKHTDPIVIGVTKQPGKPDAHRTTVSESKDRPREYRYVSDYDHFAFDMDVWSPDNAKREFGLEDERFFVFEGEERRSISDHLPIVIKTAKF